MAGSKGQTTGVKTKLYAEVTAASLTATANQTYTGLVGTGKLVLAANEVKKVSSIGDQEQSANIINYVSYGEGVAGAVPGAAELGEFVFSVNLDNTDTSHLELLGLDGGDEVEFAVVTDTGTTNKSVDYIRGYVASVSKSTPVDGVAQLTVSIAMSQEVVRVHQS